MDPTSARSRGSIGSGRIQTVYFAYGSNMHLGQMAERCPESRYLGHGRLCDWKWQINSRGYANIVQSRGNYVEGLCYLLSRNDEKNLDRFEGVPTAYGRFEVLVEIWAAKTAIVGRRVKEVDEQHLPDRRIQYRHQPTMYDNPNPPEKILTLVYVNLRERENGDPKREYIGRMNYAIQDALHLGVSSNFLEREIQPTLQLQVSKADARAKNLEGNGQDDSRRAGKQPEREVQYGSSRQIIKDGAPYSDERPAEDSQYYRQQYPDNHLISRLSDEVSQPIDVEEGAIADAMHHQSLTPDDIQNDTEN